MNVGNIQNTPIDKTTANNRCLMPNPSLAYRSKPIQVVMSSVIFKIMDVGVNFNSCQPPPSWSCLRAAMFSRETTMIRFVNLKLLISLFHKMREPGNYWLTSATQAEKISWKTTTKFMERPG
jgi:hypothetical protein